MYTDVAGRLCQLGSPRLALRGSGGRLRDRSVGPSSSTTARVLPLRGDSSNVVPLVRDRQLQSPAGVARGGTKRSYRQLLPIAWPSVRSCVEGGNRSTVRRSLRSGHRWRHLSTRKGHVTARDCGSSRGHLAKYAQCRQPRHSWRLRGASPVQQKWERSSPATTMWCGPDLDPFLCFPASLYVILQGNFPWTSSWACTQWCKQVPSPWNMAPRILCVSSATSNVSFAIPGFGHFWSTGPNFCYGQLFVFEQVADRRNSLGVAPFTATSGHHCITRTLRQARVPVARLMQESHGRGAAHELFTLLARAQSVRGMCLYQLSSALWPVPVLQAQHR